MKPLYFIVFENDTSELVPKGPAFVFSLGTKSAILVCDNDFQPMMKRLVIDQKPLIKSISKSPLGRKLLVAA